MLVFEVVESDHGGLVVPEDAAGETRAVLTVEEGQCALGACIVGPQCVVCCQIFTKTQVTIGDVAGSMDVEFAEA